ncbi:hypothetical protein ACX8XP_13175 [Calditrichota bacterium LG25]
MNKYLNFFITLSIFLAYYTFSYSQNNLKFANYLFKKGEYYRAITEYHRSLFSGNLTKSDSAFCILQIAKSYYFGEDYEGALSWINSNMNKPFIPNTITNQLNYYAGLCYFKSGFFKSSFIQLSQIKNDAKSSLMSGISCLYLNDWEKSKCIFDSLSNLNNSTVQHKAQKLSKIAAHAGSLNYKNPILAGTLSALLPGGGYAYTKHYQTAFSSFILNTFLIGTCYEFQKQSFKFASGATFIVAFGWYVGNILGSYKSAVRYNERIRKKYLDKKLKDFLYY